MTFGNMDVFQVLGNIVERGALFSELDYMNVLQLLHRYGIPLASPHLPLREVMRFMYFIREKGSFTCPIPLLCVYYHLLVC
jgi:hypothetical protein